MFSLNMRMSLLIAVLFSIVYAVVVMVGTAMGIGNFYFYLILSLGMMFFQYMMGPKMVEWSMRVRYVERNEYPDLYAMVEEQARLAGLPMPRICVSPITIPNAFAFGRGQHDGRVCATEGILKLLNKEELRAVIGHELTHLKNRDVVTITLLSVIPILMYRLAWHLIWYGGGRRNERNQTMLIGFVALIFYFITNLLVLYASRIREYFADKGSVELGNRPAALATALYKLVYGSARMDKDTIKEAEGFKAFFLNDPSVALDEIKELSQLDINKSGTIDSDELMLLRNKRINITSADRMMEIFGTHPNMLKRIRHLAELENA